MFKRMKSIMLITLSTAIFTGCAMWQKEPAKIKVMSYNIRHGADMKYKMNLMKQADVIKAQNADFVGLQEIDKKCARSENKDQMQVLGKYLQATPTFGKFMNLQKGEYGMGTLCKLPLVSAKVVKLPPATHEPRCAIINVATLGNGKQVTLANVHFDWLDDASERRIEQAKALLKEIDKLALPAIILGDFNTQPNSPTMKYFATQGFIFMDKGEDNLTFQGKGTPTVEIDHVIYRSTKETVIKGVSIDLLDEPVASDHRPVVAELLVY